MEIIIAEQWRIYREWNKISKNVVAEIESHGFGNVWSMGDVV